MNPKRVWRRFIRNRALSKASPEHKKDSCLLKDLMLDHPDPVWCDDRAYIRMLYAFIYLTVIMDWYIHYVLAL